MVDCKMGPEYGPLPVASLFGWGFKTWAFVWYVVCNGYARTPD